MHHSVVILMLQTLAYLIFVQGAVNAIRVSQNGCHNTNISLNCSYYLPLRPGFPVLDLKWYIREKTRQKLAGINENGRRKMYSGKPELMNRLTLHRNGLLEISSLRPEDEAVYECVVRGGPHGLRTYQIQLSVACGKVTRIQRKVCVEEDVVLECDAKHRTNPRKLKRISWKKETVLENGSSYSLVSSKDGVWVQRNHSLLLPKGREARNDTFRCHVTKKDGSRPDMHFVKAASVKCHKDAPQTPAATVKTTQGRVVMTTGSPTKSTEVVMETTASQSTIPDEKLVCGGVLKDTAGTFQSPNFPKAYPANTHCEWTISLPQEYAAINITFDHVTIEQEDSCQHDYIAIHDELGNQFGCRTCGTRKFPRKIQVKGRVAVVTFHSDSSVNKSGFKITYKAVRTAEKSVL